MAGSLMLACAKPDKKRYRRRRSAADPSSAYLPVVSWPAPTCDIRGTKEDRGKPCPVGLETATLTSKYQLIENAPAGVLNLAHLIPVISTPTLQFNADYYQQITIIFDGNNTIGKEYWSTVEFALQIFDFSRGDLIFADRAVKAHGAGQCPEGSLHRAPPAP